jgi:polyisoprenoid-binding protein YceI
MLKHQATTFASAAFFVTSLALASDTWILDSSKSTARLFQGSRTNPDPMNTGVAHVTGKVKLDTNDLDASFFDLSIYPADEDWGHALSPVGTWPTGYVSGATDQTLLTFTSTRILTTGNGKLKVIGNLTLTRVRRTAIATPTEAYAGPVYGDPVIRDETREITFLFPTVSAAYLSEALTPAMAQKIGVLEIVGSARVDGEEFPELLSAIAATRDDNCHKLASVGKDYSGSQRGPATGSQTTIVLDLRFLRTVPEPSGETRSGKELERRSGLADRQVTLTKAR